MRMGKKRAAVHHHRFIHVEPKDAPAWNALRDQWFADYPFDNATRQQTIQRVAEADWLFRQEQLRYNEAESNLVSEHGDPLQWSNDQHKRLQVFERRLDRAEQCFLRWQRAAEQQRRARFTETLRLEAHEWRRETHQIARAQAQARLCAAQAEVEAEKQQSKSPFDNIYHRRPHHHPQYIEASIEDGVTVTTCNPSTQSFLDMLTNSAQPHETVERTLRVVAPFPPEYDWFRPGAASETVRFQVWITTVEQCRQDLQRELAAGHGHLLPSPHMILHEQNNG